MHKPVRPRDSKGRFIKSEKEVAPEKKKKNKNLEKSKPLQTTY
jgi:hypothetical protein